MYNLLISQRLYSLIQIKWDMYTAQRVSYNKIHIKIVKRFFLFLLIQFVIQKMRLVTTQFVIKNIHDMN